ncbi:MAG: hypothetical protein Q9162_003161 [Coniocarpon cinnabarinum]
MASNSLSVPAPPRTPTPPSDESPGSVKGLGFADGLGTERTPSFVTREFNNPYPSQTLQPSQIYGSFSSTKSTPAMTLSPALSSGSLTSPYDQNASESAIIDDSASERSVRMDNDSISNGPFRFQTRVYTPAMNRSPKKSVVSQQMGQRRGHKYKHSSVSHQIFLEPPPRKPLRLPASLPVPTLREGWKSMTQEQTIRMGWCFCHLFVAAFVQWSAQGSLALTALSHLIFYDAIGAFLCAFVGVLSNFEVWKRSSIRQPFGLERSEVLVGFAMSILLLFMGFDLISHNVSHALERHGGDHEPHREHVHTNARISSASITLVSVFATGSTIVSAVFLRNHARMARSMRFGRLASMPGVLSNPSHFLTVSFSALLLILPFFGWENYMLADKVLSTSMAIAMCVLGYYLVQALGSMLLMSYSPPAESGSVGEVVRDIATDPSVKTVEEAKVWQVHYGLCLASLRLRIRGGSTEDSMLRLKERVQSMVKNKLGGGYGGGSGASWEVSTMLIPEAD